MTPEQWEAVWRIADATLRAGTGELTDMAFATCETLMWVRGASPETPVTRRHHERRVPSGPDVAEQLAAARELMRRATSFEAFVPLRGAADALSFVLGGPGPFWWSQLYDERAGSAPGR